MVSQSHHLGILGVQTDVKKSSQLYRHLQIWENVNGGKEGPEIAGNALFLDWLSSDAPVSPFSRPKHF